MLTVKPFYPFLLGLILLSGACGCTTLPDVASMIAAASPSSPPRPILSSRGVLSPQQSQKIIARLKRSVDPTDILERHTAVVESITDSPLTKGNRVNLLTDGPATYSAMFKAIKGARNHIHLESYIIEDDEAGRSFADLLQQKAGEGVEVRIIYDSLGSLKTPDLFFQRLREGGIAVVAFNPLNPLENRKKWGLDHRDHRKILLVDGKIAIIGGINISKVYSSTPFRRRGEKALPVHWRDTDVQIEGPAVAELQKLFLATWLEQQGEKLSGEKYFPAGEEQGKALIRIIASTPGESNRIPFIVYVSAITFAEQSIHLTNSYFFPDPQIIKALTAAARRGVDVKILLPGSTDSILALHAQRHNYSRLLKAGVRIYEHKDSLLHAKTAVIDEVWSTVGSTNLDFLSLLKNDEVNAVILNKEFAGEMEKMFLLDIENSTEISWPEWQKRPFLPRVGEWFVSLFVHWL